MALTSFLKGSFAIIVTISSGSSLGYRDISHYLRSVDLGELIIARFVFSNGT